MPFVRSCHAFRPHRLAQSLRHGFGLQHFTRKFPYKVVLVIVKFWHAFRLRRLTQSLRRGFGLRHFICKSSCRLQFLFYSFTCAKVANPKWRDAPCKRHMRRDIIKGLTASLTAAVYLSELLVSKVWNSEVDPPAFRRNRRKAEVMIREPSMKRYEKKTSPPCP